MRVSKVSKSQRWASQSSKRPKGTYVQVYWTGDGGRRRTITLGYVSEHEAQEAVDTLQAHGPRLLDVRLTTGEVVPYDDPRAPTGVHVHDDDAVREASRTPPAPPPKRVKVSRHVEPIEAVEEVVEVHTKRRFDPAHLHLESYWKTIYWPARQVEVCAGTIKRELWYWEQRVLPALGKLKVREVTGHVLDRFLTSHADWSGSARRICLNAIRCLLKHAFETGVIPEVRVRPVKDSTKRSRSRPVALSSQEVSALLDAALSPAHRALFAYCVGQGLRPAEATALHWEDVDWARGRVRVRGTKNSLADRVVPLTPATLAELTPYWTGLGKPELGSAFLWRGRPIGDWKHSLHSAARRAGIETDASRRIFPYLLRHTFATGAALAGVPKIVTKELLGHSSTSDMLDTVYANPSLSQLQESVARMTRLGG